MQSVIDRPLLERLDLLKAAIQPPPGEGIPVGRGTVQGRLAKLVPNEFVLDHTTCSKICHTMEDIQAAFDEAIRVQVIMAEAARQEKKRNSCAYWRQFNEKLSIIQGCPGLKLPSICMYLPASLPVYLSVDN